jgi:transcriptional regulator with XRE-family HTH domain
MEISAKPKGANVMAIGARLRQLREHRKMSQDDVERLTGLLRCYTSRVEHGHTVPSLGTLEKYAAAFSVPLCQLFYEGDEPPPLAKLTPRKTLEELAKEPGKKGAEARFLLKLKKLLSKVKERDRAVFLATAQKLAVAKR